MALIAAAALFLVGVLGAALSRQLTDEFKAWIPWVIRRVIERAAARLPEDEQERSNEEWQSHVNEVPGDIGKLCVALGCLVAARRMSLILRPRIPHVPRNILNMAISGILLIVIAPLFLLIVLGLWLTNSGNVFDVTETFSTWEGGRNFRIYSFSTDGRVGRFLLYSQLFLLPTLLNTLRGDFPLVLW